MGKQEYNRAYYQRNGDRLREASRQWRLLNPEKYEKLVKSTQEKYYELKAGCTKSWAKVCARCGFTDERALQIDHVNGCGYEERKRCKSGAYLRRVLADTEGKYQILCANCNWIKKSESELEQPSIYTPAKRERLV